MAWASSRRCLQGSRPAGNLNTSIGLLQCTWAMSLAGKLATRFKRWARLFRPESDFRTSTDSSLARRRRSRGHQHQIVDHRCYRPCRINRARLLWACHVQKGSCGSHHSQFRYPSRLCSGQPTPGNSSSNRSSLCRTGPIDP